MFLVNSPFLVRIRAFFSKINSLSSVAIGVLFFSISSCQDQLPSLPEPDNLLSEEKMVEILTELSVLESDAQLKYVQTIKYADILSKSGDSLIKSKGVTPVDFESSMDYYGSRQQEMIQIYQLVNANLLAQKKHLEKQVMEERRAEDSED